MTKVFIDGKEGTTGLKIFERFAKRDDIDLIEIDSEKRKDIDERAKCINASDITFLCLPDMASFEAVNLVKNNKTKIIDSSTFFRTDKNFAYGFPELSLKHREDIRKSKRVAVAGCHASGFLSIIYPLITLGILPKNYPLCCFSLTGYSGGGKKMIAEYEAENRDEYLNSPRIYALEQTHKHLKEMQYVAKLDVPPLFSPIVADFYSGMAVSVPLYSSLIGGVSSNDVFEILSNYYKKQKMIEVVKDLDGKFLPANFMANRNDMKIYVGGNDERIMISSIFDNLGKGASGGAMQCMNIMLGLEEDLFL